MLRVVLLVVSLCAPLVPGSRRGTWRAQWRADLWHYHNWLLSHSGRSRLARAAALIARSAACVPHAICLRCDEWSVTMLTHDIKHAWRALVRRPAFTIVAVLVLGVGIGANATIFSWVESIVLQPVAGVDSSELVALHGKTASRDDLSFSYPNYVDLRTARPDGLTDVMAFRGVALNLRPSIGSGRPEHVEGRAEGEPRRVWGQLVTGNFFDVLGIRPILGRGFQEYDVSSSQPVVVLSHHAWQHLFSSDPGIVGRSITLNARPFTVIGVGPPRFRGTMASLSLDLFVPMSLQRAFMSGDRLPQRGNSFLQVFGRVAPGASLERVQASLDVIAARLAKDHHENAGRGMVAEPLWRDGAAGLLLPLMATLMAVVGIVLLIACANLAGLLLARAFGRQREMAVRLAIGASRGRVMRHMLVESAMLALAGGAAGIIIAIWTSGALTAFIPPTPFPVSFDVVVNARVALFAAILVVAATFASGLVPALRASRPDVSSTLKESAGTLSGASSRGRLRSGLVVVQVALSLLLLVSAALFLRGLGRARTLDPGFGIRTGIMAAIDLLPNGYDATRGSALHQMLLSRVKELPGVESATVAQAMPLDISSGSNMIVDVEGYRQAEGEEIDVYYNRVGPDYFATMQIPLVAGRALDANDIEGRQLSVVINETMARRYWGGESPLGRTVRFGSGPATVVGVARDGKYGQLTEKPRNYMYIPMAQYFRHDGLLIVRTSGAPASIVSMLQAEVRKIDPDLPLFDARTVEEHMTLSVFIPKMASTVLALFGFVALLLAVLGLYGVVAFGVAQRTREIGVRMAMGATRGQILALVMRQALVLTGSGMVIGGLLAAAAAHALRSQLMGLDPVDPMAFGVTSALLLLVSLVACSIPARRATRLDPVRALRLE